MSREIYRKGERIDVANLRSAVLKSSLAATVKCDFISYIESGDEKSMLSLQRLVYDFFEASKAIDNSKKNDDIRLWAKSVVDKLNPSLKGYSEQQINLVLALILNEQIIRDQDYNDLFCRFTEMYSRERRVY